MECWWKHGGNENVNPVLARKLGNKTSQAIRQQMLQIMFRCTVWCASLHVHLFCINHLLLHKNIFSWNILRNQQISSSSRKLPRAALAALIINEKWWAISLYYVCSWIVKLWLNVGWCYKIWVSVRSWRSIQQVSMHNHWEGDESTLSPEYFTT